MLTLPKVVERREQPYLGIRENVPMTGIPQMADRNFPALLSWFGTRKIEPAGAPFFRYHVINMDGLLDIEVGMPVARPEQGDSMVKPGVLPGGRFAILTFWGPYDQLLDANAVLIGWARQTGIEWDMETKADGDHFGCRLEVYNTDPAAETDASKWETEVLIKMA